MLTGVFTDRRLPAARKDGVSVIICARNNREGLEENLDSILRQDYHDFEVIVVNDGSTDGTKDFLDQLASQNDRLKVLHLDIDDRFHRGKKFAQTIGIKAAKNQNLLFTDSDCMPVSDQWLKRMTAYFTEGKQIVLGISHNQKSVSFLNWIIQLETFHTSFLYVNLAFKSRAYMGLGRNLAYKRDLFFSIKGFASHQHIMSGDDDLFVNETATKSNVAVCIEPETVTSTRFKGGFSKWLKQKKRHFSTGRYYRPGDKLRLGIYYFSLFFMYFTGILAGILTQYWIFVLAVTAVYLIIQGIVLHKNMKALGYLTYFPVYVFMDISILLIQIFVGIRGYFSKPKSW